MRRLLPLLLLLAGCIGSPLSPADPDPTKPPVREEPDRPTAPQPAEISDLVFAPDKLHVVDITVDPAFFPELDNGGEDRIPARIVYDGITLDNAGIRKKCGIGSCTAPIANGGKVGFSLKFDEFIPGQNLLSLDKLVLNNARQDNSYSNELLGQEIARRAGIPFKRVAHARVNFNNEFYGLFVVVEAVDKNFLRRHFGDNNDEGNLYEGPCCSDFVFNPNNIELKDIEEGRTRDDLIAFGDFIRNNTGEAFATGLEARLDVEKYITSYALGALYYHWDGYEYNTNNYFMYNNPIDDRFTFWLHGMDQLFQDCQWPIDATPRGLLGQRILTTPGLVNRYRDEITRILDEAWDSDALVERLDAARAIYEQAADEDPFQPFDEGRFNSVRQCLIDRPNIVRAQVVSLCGDAEVSGNELCDDGANGQNGDGCRDDCTVPACGDRILDLGEGCDDGNNTSGDGCSASCLDENGAATCGNGFLEVGEQCDDGNTAGGDSCNAGCALTCSGADGNGISPVNGRCYQFFGQDRTWQAARDFCAARGGHLVTLSGRAEENFIRSLSNNAPWIGFSDLVTEGTFAWVNGERVTYTNFSAGEPNDFNNNEDCTQLSGNGWNDLACGANRGAICEYD